MDRKMPLMDGHQVTMLNPNSPIPLYRQLADLLTAKIRAGEYTGGSRIASEHQLAATYGVGRPTIRQAVDLLVRKGLVVRKRGSGTYVCEPHQEVDLFSLDGTSASFRNKGFAVETKMLTPVTLQVIERGKENPFTGDRAYWFSRLTCVADTPVLVETLYLHAGLFSGIDQIDLQGRSLSTIADEQFYLRPVGGKQSFRIELVDGDKGRQLELRPKSPILMVNRWLHFPYTPDGVFTELWCRTDQFVFSQTIGGTGYA
jgi:GntR family transcriptional regulator